MSNELRDQFLTTPPAIPLLETLDSPEALRQLLPAQLPQVAEEIRQWLLYCVPKTGGHFGAGLGVVELTIALHYLLNTPDDAIVWDVGHQCYPHKILTGRRQAMLSMRQKQGLAPFPSRSESPYDAFGTGHSSTSISAALGMALAAGLQQQEKRCVAVIGDGAMTAGMAFEALNHAGHTQANLLVILNDNDMSISPNEGGLATYLATNHRATTEPQLDGRTTASLFEALNFTYTGPIDGHDFAQLLPALKQVLNQPGPQFLHLITQKGRGFAPAEADPVGFHALNKLESPSQTDASVSTQASTQASTQPSARRLRFCNHFARWVCQQAQEDLRLVAITPAMREGSDLVAFSQKFPERYFDVAIAEQHAATLAAGFAVAGCKPVLAIYSTFLQRAYDQWIHDIALQKLDVLIAVDRAGLVGEDGATHAGCYDLAFLRCLPEMLLLTPADGQETERMLAFAYQHPGPAAVRYPRGTAGELPQLQQAPPLPQAHLLRQGSQAALLNFGPLLPQALIVAEALDLTLVDMRLVKPLDHSMLKRLQAQHSLWISLEDHAQVGGAGSALAEYLQQEHADNALLILGIPDRWIEHASREEQLAECGLDAAGIEAQIRAWWASSPCQHKREK
ncbi:1-deoxy-D-xylulose-5-phosphate synthase [Nitrincola tapanii]|uniref:1-deoxy-D-xylulose-5-phosphate synthase n=1 Tax=Nitrincola tapanii TaxID=1708751 RepID=A0A5A9W770_9GAMM|nr:1-deoxy-D-xylulose-5-phosphate synthase [Nitrincola tapanii]KAA0876304.1 1-deoxy-D-xylulose-5-phosphate synthase [Nitrincola tapanii]